MSLQSFAQALELFSILDRDRACVISGGEPSTLPNLEQYVKVAHDLGYTVTIVTNGYNIERVINAGADLVEVSIDRVGMAHDKERGVDGLWENIIKAVTSNCRVVIRSTLMKNNIKDIKLMRKMFSDTPIFVMPVRGCPEIKPTPEQIEEISKLENVFISNNCPAGIHSFVITPSEEGSSVDVLACFIYRRKLGTLKKYSRNELKKILEEGRKIPRFPCEKK